MGFKYADGAPQDADLTGTLPIAFRAIPGVDSVTLEVVGELDLSTTIAFVGMVRDLVDGDLPVRLDLSDLSFMDVSGLHALETAILIGGNRVRIEPGVQPQVRRLLELTHSERLCSYG